MKQGRAGRDSWRAEVKTSKKRIPSTYVEWKHFGQGKQQVQRPWGGNVWPCLRKGWEATSLARAEWIREGVRGLRSEGEGEPQVL